MGNAVGSFFSGFAQVVGNNLGHPLDFLSGKSCNSVCGSTWDILCYIENFCVAHLLKLGMVATLSYFDTIIPTTTNKIRANCLTIDRLSTCTPECVLCVCL
ncbi:uncharacterized protein LOC105155229 isoform X1 [Sesamum indicum]|uniref:Uncharacterized protein LOC105155229 isoform X1 n=1 Tax=Sesamum indicum TaxID=4182 RepID=A0A6I9SJB5_SESIN|nr:uncharacterized protein LOC105155229 isoform X1 [Sesamum indicum]